MIESIMFFGIGFLAAILIALAVIPLVHGRAVRLTIRRLQDSIPRSMAEIQANKDALRAEFAMSTRRLEITVDGLKTEHANQLAELGKRGDAVKRLQIERETQNVEAAALKAKVVALNERLAAADEEIKAAKSPNHKDDFVSLVPEADLAGEERPSAGLVKTADRAHDPDQRLVGRRNGRFTSMQVSRNLGRLSAAALIIAGVAFVWQQYHTERARDALKRIPSLDRLLSMPVTKSLSADVVAGKTDSTSSEMSTHDAEPRPAPVIQSQSAPAAAISPNTSEPAAKEEQLSDQIPAVEPNPRQEMSSPPLPNGPIAPEPKVASLEGWTVREVANGIAVLEGPAGGIWRATPGDTLPGAGKVESYIRSNGDWIVATSNGLISMQARQNTSSSPLRSDPVSTPATSAKTIEDWTLREVASGTAVLQGPVGISKVTVGETLAGLGKVTAIVRWGKGWVVATTVGYCTSGRPDHADGYCKRYSAADH